MGVSRNAVLALSFSAGLLGSVPLAHAQTLPLEGPGLGNLTYTDAEVMNEFPPELNPNTPAKSSGSVIRWNTPATSTTEAYTNGIPQKQFTLTSDRKYANGNLVSGELGTFRTGQTMKAYGNNVGIMLNGYFVTMFAPDSGFPTGGFLLYDVSNPRDIKLVKTVYDPEGSTRNVREPHAFGVSTINGKDYVTVPTITGVEFWDFTDINDIKKASSLELPGVSGGDYNGVNWQMWWQAPYLYVSGASVLYIVDAKDPLNPKLADRGAGKPNPISNARLGGFRLGPIFSMGNRLLLGSMETESGFATLDISDPLNPVVTATQQSLPFYYATCFNGKKLYSSGRNANGTMVGYDITDPKTIKEDTRVTTQEGLYCASQDNVVIVGEQATIARYNVSSTGVLTFDKRSSRASGNPDLGQVAMFGNIVFIGSDHGENTGFRPHQKEPDTTRPHVIAQSPDSLAVKQRVSSRIGFGLSDSILPETVNAQNFIVRKKADGVQVSGLYSVQLGMINFAPAEPLELDVEYEVVLKANGLKDYAGNALAEDFTTSFTTGIPPVPPVIIRPPEGDLAYVNRWLLDGSLTDIVSGNDGTPGAGDVYTEGGLDFTARTAPVMLESDAITETLGGTATVSFRIKTTQVGTNTMWQAPGILGRDQAGASNDIFWGWIDGSGRLALQVGDDGGNAVKSAARINDGVWHNVAMTRNADTGELAMYVDGAKTSTLSLTGIKGLTNRLQRIGQMHDSTPLFRGVLADLRIYDKRALTEKEAASIFDPNALTFPVRTAGSAFTINPADLGLIGGEQYVWNFGDGSPNVITLGANPIVNYAYAKPGNYTVSVTMVDAEGGQVTVSFVQIVTHPLTANPPVHSSNIVGDETRVYSLDPDAGTVTAINKATQAKTWEIAVGKEPKTLAIAPNGELWVTVQGDDKLVRINPTTQNLTSVQLDYGSAPYGVAIAPNGTGVVTLAGDSTIATFNSLTGVIQNKVVLPDGDLRGIAVSFDSATAYVTRFRSKMTQGEVYKVSLAGLGSAATIPLAIDTTTLPTEAAAPGIPNYVNQVVIAPDGRRAILPSKKDNIVAGRFRNATDLKHDSTVRSIVSQIDLATGSEVFDDQMDFNNKSAARAALFTPLGNYLFVAEIESGTVQIVDSYLGNVVGQIAGVGKTPHGLYLDATARKLYVNNFLERNVTVHDIGLVLSGLDLVTLAPKTIATVATEPLVANVLAGKKVFYNAADPRMSNESYISCASCHVDGDTDGMVWDFTQRGEGLRRTISLQGKQGLGQTNYTAYKQRQVVDRTSLASVSAATNELASRVATVKRQGIASGAAMTKVAELARVVPQLQANIAALSPPGAPGQVGFLADEFNSLQDQFITALNRTMAPSRLHWTGNFDELQDFENDIRNEFGGTGFLSPADFQATADPLGAKKAGRSSDLDNLTAYITSLQTFPRSSQRDAQGCLTAAAVRGKQTFDAKGCVSCHGGSITQDNARHDVGTIQASSGKGSNQPLAGKGFDTPTLYGLSQSSSFFHNGRAATLKDVFATGVSPQHGGKVAANQVNDLVAYLHSLDAGQSCPAGAQ